MSPRREALGTPVFWLIAVTFGVAQIGVTGLNLMCFPTSRTKAIRSWSRRR